MSYAIGLTITPDDPYSAIYNSEYKIVVTILFISYSCKSFEKDPSREIYTYAAWVKIEAFFYYRHTNLKKMVCPKTRECGTGC